MAYRRLAFPISDRNPVLPSDSDKPLSNVEIGDFHSSPAAGGPQDVSDSLDPCLGLGVETRLLGKVNVLCASFSSYLVFETGGCDWSEAFRQSILDRVNELDWYEQESLSVCRENPFLLVDGHILHNQCRSFPGFLHSEPSHRLKRAATNSLAGLATS